MIWFISTLKNITFFTNFHFRLILPNGLRFCTDKEIRTLVPKSHSFVLTKEDGEKSLGYVLQICLINFRFQTEKKVFLVIHFFIFVILSCFHLTNCFGEEKFAKRKQVEIKNIILQRPEVLCRFVFDNMVNERKKFWQILFLFFSVSLIFYKEVKDINICHVNLSN